jgi:hypothetical protein
MARPATRSLYNDLLPEARHLMQHTTDATQQNTSYRRKRTQQRAYR